jgi:hypothetical protein
MSDKPEPEDDDLDLDFDFDDDNREMVGEPALKLTGLLVWLGLLAACAFSSIYLVFGIVQGTVFGRSILFATDPFDTGGNEQTIAGLALGLIFLAALSLLGSWIMVAKAVQHLVEEAASGGGLEGSGAPVGWLGNPVGFPFSIPGTAVVLLGVTWAILMITPPFLAYMELLLRD